MNVREIKARDADAWLRMRASLWPEADARELAREVRSFIAGGKEALLTAVYVADDGTSQPLGFLELSVRAFSDGCDTRPVPHVEGWFVESSARGHAIGRSLMRAAEEWSRQRGFKELASDSELKNESAQRAQRRCGFEEVDRLVKFRKVLT